MCEEGVYGRLL